VLFSIGYFAAGWYPRLQQHYVLTTLVLCAIAAASFMLIVGRRGRRGRRGCRGRMTERGSDR
jgi:hypothetical protein